MAESRDLGPFLVGVSAVAGAGAVALWLGNQHSGEKIGISQLVDPAGVQALAASFPQDKDGFILAAWRYAADNIVYSGYGSVMYFYEDYVKCQRCLQPQAVLVKGNTNCVGKSILLASLLRNKLPASKVFVAVGDLNKEGIGGHAWVLAQRGDGVWYLLEATSSPKGWVRAQDVAKMYIPKVLFNDETIACADKELCVTVKSHICLPCLLGQ